MRIAICLFPPLSFAAVTFTQPPGWPYAEGALVPHGRDITVDLWFEVKW